MPTWRVMRSALSSFLGTLTSRNPDHGGYWIWGQVEQQLADLNVDLLAEPPEASTPMAAGARLARTNFREQVEKAGFSVSVVRGATLNVALGPAHEVRAGSSSPYSEGHVATFMVVARMDDGRTFAKEATIFVAPHSRSHEMRRSASAP